MWIGLRFLLLVAGILAVNFQLALRQGMFAEPISVTVEGVPAEVIASAHARAYFVGSDELVPPTGLGRWECPPRCVGNFFVQIPLPVPEGAGVVRVEIGDRSFTLPLHEMQHYGINYWLPDHVSYGPTVWFAPCRNWPGNDVFWHFYLRRTAPGLVTVLVLALVSVIALSAPFRRRCQAILGFVAAPTAGADASSRWWNLAGLAFLIGAFVGMQVMQPYYFTQDDALIGELPAILLASRSLTEGVFPDWNPYVFLGSPLAPMGFWGVTYPPQLLAYAIARYLLRDECATMEVLAALHLLIGFLSMRHLSRRVGMGAFSANTAALSFVLAGCILIMGRSWHYFVANAVWLPFMGIAIQRFREGPVGWKWVLGVGAVLGLSYHAGFPQIAAVIGMFLIVGLTTVTIAERISLRRVAMIVPAVLLGAGLAAPLLLHHVQMTGGHERFTPVEDGAYDGLHAAALPYPLAEAELPTHWGSTHLEKMGHFYFFGGLFALLFALQATAFWLFLPDRTAWGRWWWIPCGAFALLMVLGEPAYFWKGFAELPMAKFFLRYSIRFYPWLTFCAILSGGIVLDRILASLPRRWLGETLTAGVVFGVLAYHVAMCQPSFYSYGFSPYPPLPPEFEAAFHPYEDKAYVGAKNSRRIASWYPLRSTSAEYYAALPLNMPHYYRVPSIFGYDPVVEGQPRLAEAYQRLKKEPLAACKAYGIGWHVFAPIGAPFAVSGQRFDAMEYAVPLEPAYRAMLKAELTPLAEYAGTTLKELTDVDPLAFASARPEKALPMRLHCRGADIEVAGLAAGTAVTINFLWAPQFQLSLDGQPLPVDKDDWQRITTTLPTAGATLSLHYEPPWPKTCAIGAGLCLVALLLAWGALRFREA